MEKLILLINQRFEINENLHTLTDRQTGLVTRLELRLLLVIITLSTKPKEVVSREQLIQEIWNNYGGAEEGLNQAISFLRKALADNDKQIILTIPKKGYMLNAEVQNIATFNSTTFSKKNRTQIFGLILFSIIVMVGLGYWYVSNSSTQNEPSGAVPDTTYQYKELDSVKRLDSLKRAKK
ncbi:MAG: winged helix-turn-helix domain-containing protein [Bacteroidota bacterium]